VSIKQNTVHKQVDLIKIWNHSIYINFGNQGKVLTNLRQQTVVVFRCLAVTFY